MDIESLRSTLEQATFASLAIGLAIGFLFSFNPVALASIPVSLAYVTKAHETRRAVLFGSMFVLGMIVTHVVLGFIAGLGGRWIQQFIGRQWGLILGPLLMVMGLAWPGWIKLPIPRIPIRARRAASTWGAMVLGASFSVAVCPACTPALVVLLGIAAGVGSPLFGVLLLLAFALGRTIPVILGASAMGWLENLKGLRHSQRAFEIAGGVVLILSGLYMLNAYFFWIPELAA
ncbi:MAG TPA: cytochrome c biogenesis protein CcdA [Casimicrobiaceae bacterium]|jgi:cytochrome c-type biogenesis protein|nr:cytochrome c biogenesis protein CcdA [Casimicrobiaceae bacterium]